MNCPVPAWRNPVALRFVPDAVVNVKSFRVELPETTRNPEAERFVDETTPKDEEPVTCKVPACTNPASERFEVPEAFVKYRLVVVTFVNVLEGALKSIELVANVKSTEELTEFVAVKKETPFGVPVALLPGPFEATVIRP